MSGLASNSARLGFGASNLGHFWIFLFEIYKARFSSWGGFIGFHIWGSLISPSLACLLTVGEFRDKRGVGKGTMAAEISARATFLVYFIVWRVNRI